MKKPIVINRIPTDIEDFQTYINETDDEQKKTDKHGFSIYPKDANGKPIYGRSEGVVKIVNEPVYRKWDWIEEESKEWSRFRKEYNKLYKKYIVDKANATLKKQLEDIINNCIAYDRKQQLVERVASSGNSNTIHIDMFRIRQDILEYDTPLRTISLKYEEELPLIKLEKEFIEKYIQLHSHTIEIGARIRKLRDDIKEVKNTFPAFFERFPFMKDKADLASNTIFLPPPNFKGMWSEAVSFVVPTPEINQQRVDDFNKHQFQFHAEISAMCNRCGELYEELQNVEKIFDEETGEYTDPLFKEVEELQTKVFDIFNGTIDSMSLDSDYNEFTEAFGSSVETEQASNDWEKLVDEQSLLMAIYNSFINFIQEKFNQTEEGEETEAVDISAPQKDDDTDDLRAETIKKYQTDLDNNTNNYFDTQDWHIILDAFAAKYDNKNIDIAMERALTQHPENAVMLTRYAHLEADKHNYQKALQLIKQAEEQGPEQHPNLPFGKANIYCQLHTPDLAIPIYKKLAADVRKEMTWWRTHSLDRLIDIYDEKKEYNECIKLSKEALEERKEDETLISNLALYFSNNKQYDEAEKLLTEFIKNHPESAECNERLGTIYVDLKQFEKAIECFDRTYEIDKQENYGALNLKGKALMELKKYAEAIVCFEVCILHFKLTPDYHISAAQCYAELKLEKQATYHYRKALSLDPDSKLAQDALKVFRSEQN